MPISVKLFLLLLLLISLSSPVSALEFEQCTLTGGGGNGSLTALCADWVQPLDPSQPQGEQIELLVTKLPSTAIEPAKDAFTVINGGPGGSSVEMMVDLAPVLRAFTRERDVIVIDQRGTGKSTPLTCEALTDTTEAIDAATNQALTQDCLDNLAKDPRFFTTSVAVQDLEALRQALGYDQLSVYGVSYGTRVAMHYARNYPDSTRSIVIDGVVPPEITLGSNVAFNSQDTLNRVFERCAQQPDCNAAFPNLATDFALLSERLKESPQTLNIRHPVTGLPTDIEVTYGHLAIWVRLSLYAPETAALVPFIIDQAANHNDLLPVAASALQMLHQLNASLNYGMHNAVVCSEDVPFFNDANEDFPALEQTYLGREMYDSLKSMCDIWPIGDIDQSIKAPFVSDIPTLVLSGEFDPITPPQYGDAVLPGLSNAKHIVAPGQGHGVITRGCVPRLILEFVENPDLSEVDASCTEHLSTFPFFIDQMGPSP